MERSGKQVSAKNTKAKLAKSPVQKVDSRVRSVVPKTLSDPNSDLSNVQPKIDNKPPKIDMETYYKPQSLEAEAQTVMEIDRQNFELLKKLNTIHRLGIFTPPRSTCNFLLLLSNLCEISAQRDSFLKEFANDDDTIDHKTCVSDVQGKIDCWKLDGPYKPPLAEKQSEINIITNENIELLKKIRQATSLYCTADLMREWRSRKGAKKDSKYSDHLCHQSATRGAHWNFAITDAVFVRRNAPSKDSRATGKKSKKKLRSRKELSPSRQIDGSARPRCYFEIEIQNEHRALGKIVFELFADVVPRTCENFQSFCRGFNGLSYKGTPFHRILPGYWCQGGDVTKFNGSGGTSIYGATFADENFKLKHSAPGILSTCSYGKYINDSKFNLTFERLETMDGIKVVFGKVIDGFSTLRELERYGTNNGRPIAKIVVSRCGVM